MKLSALRPVAAAVLLALLRPASAASQTWRQSAAGVGTTARVLIIGTHPEDEDNALIAWLSLGRHVETAYLSLTRGEAAGNLAGNEKQSALAVVRTAELLAERERDGAHQYFTRAYDFGFTKLDSVVEAGWPHDSLVHDVVSVVRAFRPHVIISLYADSADPNAAHRIVARLAREAFALAGDTARLPSTVTQLLPPWTPSRLLTRLDSAGGQAGIIAVDVGEFDRTSGRTYAELGAEIRRLQRTQPQPPSPPLGSALRFFRLEASRTEGRDSTFFGGVDTSLVRFKDQLPAESRASLDSLGDALADIRARADKGNADSMAVALALVVARSNKLAASIRCKDVDGVPACAAQGDAAASLGTIRDRAARTLMDAANIVIDGTVERNLVAQGDSVPLTLTVFNGSTLPITVKRLSATSGSANAVFVTYTPSMPRDSAPRPSVVVPPDSTMHWSGQIGVRAIDFHWWQFHGLIEKRWYHQVIPSRFHPVISQLISGEDRIPTSGIDATVTIAGVDVRLVKTPLVARPPGIVRGDDRRPITGVPPVSLLTDKIAEYERAGLPIDALYHISLWSAHSVPDTVTVYLTPPVGLKLDSAKRIVVLPPFGAASVFFRIHGTLKPGQDSATVVAQVPSRVPSSKPGEPPVTQVNQYQLAAIGRDYPHIPTQQYHRAATERIEIVDLHVSPRLKVAYVKGTDDVQQALGQLQINLHALEPSLLSVVDLSGFSTVLIGAGALEGDALAGAVPRLLAFMRQGGTVVVLPGGQEVASSGLLPYPIVFDSTPARISDPSGDVHAINAKSSFLTWPNAITGEDFQAWNGERARGVPLGYDLRYRTVLSMNDPGQLPTAATILSAPVGKGLIVYTSISFDRQLAAVNPGAARLFVNVLSAGLESAAAKTPAKP